MITRLLILFLLPFQAFSQWSLVSSPSLPQGEFVDIQTPDISTTYLLNDSAQLYLSTDFGSSWNLHFSFPDSQSVNQMLFINSDTGFVSGNSYTNESLLRTFDGGETWQNISQDSNNNHRRFKHPKFVDNVLYASYTILGLGTIDTMFFSKSTDYGDTWEVLHFETIDLDWFFQANITYEHHFINSEVGYLRNHNQSSQDFLLKTVDSGESWDSIFQLNMNQYGADKMKFLSDQVGYLYGYTSASYSKRIFVGTSGFTLLNPYLDQFGNLPIIDLIKVDSVAFASSIYGKIFYSTDLGFNWIEQTTPVSSKIDKISFANLDYGMAISSNEIIKTTNGGSLSLSDNNQENIELIYSENSTHLFIKSPLGEELLNTRIFNTLGQEISSWDSENEIDISRFKGGVYIVVIQTDKQHFSTKIKLN
jgi:hypothetical protein